MLGCGVNPIEKSISESISRDVLFEFEDVRGDGYGPGYYSYPRIYDSSRRNIFDVVRFSVEDAGDHIFMKFTFAEEIERNSDYFGRWDQFLIDVYIDKDQQPYSGENKTLLGRDCSIIPENAWESVVMISPMHSEWVKNYLEYETNDIRTKLLYKAGNIVVPDFYIVSYDTITAKIPKYLLGSPREWWGYQVMVMGFDENELNTENIFVRKVGATSSPNNFGGGSAYYGNSNILDILDNGKDISQKRILSDYSINPVRERAEFPRLSMIYKNKIEGKEKIDVGFSRQADKIVARESQKVQNVNDKADKDKNINENSVHIKNMKKILDAAVKYRKDKPEDINITIFDLMLSGYIDESVKAPGNNIYKVQDEKGGKIKIECNNINGEIILYIEEE
jgi:hypothetical protein